ncbi:hypothetical protein MSSIT_2130 [Methanosarcina siciliae T4/M]|uniref:Cytochrome b561 domain-containing protein n=1 Tax=Methanosarcina siciliae T4/M TaxID=1434120 RepID=A0A0E3P5C0_9EURY|nr:hypothetical protein [Methanosarcina siciliae]AKB28849.1 hypothetical protein MSSIT_2130 [Methanosarcina siciliae T4/M]
MYESWVGHALIAIISLVLMVYTLTTGAMLRGRIKRSRGNIFKLHKRDGIYFGTFMLGSFIYGLLIKLQHGESILSSVHGKLGLILILIIVLQIIPGLVLKNRARYRGLHKIVGYSLAPILVIDASWGLYNGVVAGTKSSLVLLHSISGGLAALALVWIFLEILYAADKSLARARIASYFTAFLVTAGCWIAGGYNYLTAYGFRVKPVILAGPHPWAHEIVMEAKEHIFVFLPIIVFALSITLHIFDRDAFQGETKSRRALTMVAYLALFMVLLMFLMGAVISNAGKTGTEV